MKKKSMLTFLGVLGVMIIDLIVASVNDMLKGSILNLYPPLVRLFHWLYSTTFVNWAPLNSKQTLPILEFSYIIVCLVTLFFICMGVVASFKFIPWWIEWGRNMMVKIEKQRESTETSSGVTDDPSLVIEEEEEELVDAPDVKISLDEYTRGFSQIASVVDQIEDHVNQSQASRIAEDFLIRILDSVAQCFGVGPTEYRGLYMVPKEKIDKSSEDDTNWRYVHFGRKGLLTGYDYEWIRALMVGFIGETKIESDTELVAKFEIDDIYDGKAIALLRNEGPFKLALAVVMTRADGVTPENKVKFKQISSQFLLIGNLPQITKFVIE